MTMKNVLSDRHDGPDEPEGQRKIQNSDPLACFNRRFKQVFRSEIRRGATKEEAFKAAMRTLPRK